MLNVKGLLERSREIPEKAIIVVRCSDYYNGKTCKVLGMHYLKSKDGFKFVSFEFNEVAYNETSFQFTDGEGGLSYGHFVNLVNRFNIPGSTPICCNIECFPEDNKAQAKRMSRFFGPNFSIQLFPGENARLALEPSSDAFEIPADKSLTCLGACIGPYSKSPDAGRHVITARYDIGDISDFSRHASRLLDESFITQKYGYNPETGRYLKISDAKAEQFCMDNEYYASMFI